jgi:hypothetical protein
MVTSTVVEHPLASVTGECIITCSQVSLRRSDVVRSVATVGVITTDPSAAPLHVALVGVAVAVIGSGSVMVHQQLLNIRWHQ